MLGVSRGDGVRGVDRAVGYDNALSSEIFSEAPCSLKVSLDNNNMRDAGGSDGDGKTFFIARSGHPPRTWNLPASYLSSRRRNIPRSNPASNIKQPDPAHVAGQSVSHTADLQVPPDE